MVAVDVRRRRLGRFSPGKSASLRRRLRGFKTRCLFLMFSSAFLQGCATSRPGTIAHRSGDEIVVAGQFVHCGTPVVLWMDPGGYDAYRVERRFSPMNESSWDASKAANKDLATPNRFGMRTNALTAAEMERVRGGGWDLPLLQRVV